MSAAFRTPSHFFSRTLATLLIAVVGASLLPALPAFAALSTDSLVGYWKFDETAGGSTAVDSSGDGVDGTPGGGGGPQPSTDVPSGMAFSDARSLQFDGSDRVSVSGMTAIGTSAFTISMWIKPTSLPAGNKVFLGYASDQTTLLIDTNNKINLYSGGYQITSVTAVSTDVWYHIIAVGNGAASGSRNVKLYQDGVQIGSTWTSDYNFSPTSFNIGIHSNNASEPFPGKIDDVRIYNRALAPWEISQLYNGNHIQAFWTGTNSNYESRNSWSGSYIPDPYSRVIVQAAVNQPTMTGAVRVAGLTINTGASLNLKGKNLTFQDAGVITNYGTVFLRNTETLSGATFPSEKGTAVIHSSGSTTGLALGSSYYNLTFSGAGTWTLNASLTVNKNLTLSGGTISANGNTVLTKGLTTLRSGTYQTSTATQTLSGGLVMLGGVLSGTSGKVALSGSLTLSAGAFTAPSGNLTLWGDWTKTGGTFTSNGGTVTLSGNRNQTLNAGGTDAGSDFSTLTVNKSAGSLSLVTNALSGGTINVTSGTLSPGALAITAGTLTVNGGTFSGGAGTLTVPGTITLSSGNLTAPSGSLTVGGNWTRTGGTFTHNSGTVQFDGSTAAKVAPGGQSFNNLTVNGTAKQLTLSGALTVAGTLTIGADDILSLSGSALTAATLANNNLVLARGTETLSITTPDIDSGTFRIVGDGDGAADTFTLFNPSSGTDFFNVTFAPTDSDDSFALAANLALYGALVLSRGTLQPTSFNVYAASLAGSGGTFRGSTGLLDVNGPISLTAGSLIAPSTVTLSGSFTKTGGSFLASGSTLTLDGSKQTLSGALAFYNLTKIVTAANTLTLYPGHTYAVTGALVLQGAASNLLSLRSAIADTAATLKLVTGGTQTIDYLDVKDSEASGGEELVCLIATEGCSDSGNNTNWLFATSAAASSSSSSAAATESVSDVQRQGAGGRRGSTEDMAKLIAQAHQTILARYEGRSRDTQIVQTTSSSSRGQDLIAQDAAEERAAKQREQRIAARIREHEVALRDLEAEKDELQQKYAMRREERLAQALAEKEKQIAKEEHDLLAHQEELAAEQEKNRIAREQRLALIEAHAASAARVSSAGTSAAGTSSAPGSLVIGEKRGRLTAVLGEETVLYVDVESDAWYAPFVAYAIEEGIATGYDSPPGEPKTFGVVNPITRAEALKMILEASNIEMTAGQALRNRSAKGTWAAAYVAKAEELGMDIVTPDWDVNAAITRGEAIHLLLLGWGLPRGPRPADFPDVPVDHPFSPDIGMAFYLGIIEGYPDGTAQPDAQINRAEFAKIITQMAEVMQ